MSATPNETTLLEKIQDLIRSGNGLDDRILDVQRLISKAELPSANEIAKYRKAYVDLLWDSRSVAGTARAAVEALQEVAGLSLQHDISSEDKISELKNLKENTKKKATNARAHIDSMVEFHGDLQSYVTRLREEMKTQDIKQKAQLKDLRQQLDRIDASIQSAKNKDNHGSSSRGGIIHSLKSIVCCVRHISVPSSPAEVSEAQKEQDKSKELNSRIKQLEQKQKLLQDASDIPATVKTVANGIEILSEKLKIFNKIYEECFSDNDTLVKLVTDHNSEALNTKVDSLRPWFETLKEALYTYAKAPTS